MKTFGFVVAAALLLAWFGPKLDHNGDEFEMADQIAAEQKEKERFERAVQALCGENAGWVELGDGTIQCTTKHGKRTHRVELAEGGAK